ncbi:sugar-binding domain-containing protein, partial [Escherichia coli]
ASSSSLLRMKNIKAQIAVALKVPQLVPIATNEEIIPRLPFGALKTIPVRVGVAGGENKAEAIAAAMKGGYINALVTDQDTAAAILRS